MDDGASSKAAKHLLSSGLHDSADAEVRKALEALHPAREPISETFHTEMWPVDTSPEGQRARLKALKQSILQFPLGSAAGPSGLRPQHLQDIIRKDAGIAALLLEALDEFCITALRGTLPAEAAPFLCGAKLIPLKKPGAKTAVRPIAVGETLRRLVGKTIMASPAVQDAVTNMLPLQLGVAVEGACETTTIALQHWINEHRQEPDWAVLQVDLTNAFNSIDRKCMLAEVANRAPKLSAWAQYCYRDHSHLFLQNGHPLSSQQGVQQGDPLGPLFFSLAWHQVVETMPADLRMHLWYLDDGHLVGNQD